MFKKKPSQIKKTLAIKYIKTSSLLLLSTAFISVASAQDYYVSPNGNNNNPGTLAKPWKSIAKANPALRAGDTLFLRQGTYKENIKPAHSGTANNKIVYTNYQNETAKVVGDSAKTTVAEIRQSYIVIKGLTLYHEKKPNCKGYGACWNYQSNIVDIRYPDAHHNEILNNKIISPYSLPKLDTEVYIKETGVAIGNSAHHNLIQGNEIRNMSKIGIGLGKAPMFTRIINNKIIDIYQDCIHYGSGKNIITGTLIEGNTLAGSIRSDGFQANSKIAENRGIILRNNIIYNNGENNIDLKGTRQIIIEGNTLYAGKGDNDGPTKQNNHTDPGVFSDRFGGYGGISHGGSSRSEDVIIRNNILYDNASGIAVKNSLRWKIYNNTIVNNTRDYEGPNSNYTRGTRNPVFLGVQVGSGKQQLLNNIIGDSPEGEVKAAGPGTNSDYNLYFNTYKATEFAHFKAKHDWDLVNLNQWKNITKGDKNSLDTNPKFVNVPSRPFGNHTKYNFSLKSNSPAIDAGNFLTTTVGSGSGKTIKVKDARFFYNGFGVTAGDTLQLQGQTKTAKVTNVDYASNTITVNTSLTWAANLGVSLPYKGSAPDIGAIEAGSTTSTPSDTQAPSTPTNLQASAITHNSMTLNWNVSTDNVGVSGYEVHYNGKVKSASSNSIILSGLTPNLNYSIKVLAKDAAGNKSGFSAPETAVTDADTSTTTPVLVANAGSDKLLRCTDSYRTLGKPSGNKPSSDGATYSWTTSNGSFEGSTNSKTVKGTKAGTYTLTVSKKGSKSVSDTVVITKEKGCETTPVVKVSLSYKASTGGTITGETNQTINKGATGKKVTAVANDGYHFTSWSDDLKEAARVDYKVSKNTTLTASFEKDAVVVTPPADTAPEATTLIGPTGSTIDTTPTYTWKSVSNTKWYYLWTLDNTDKRTGKWYKASELGCENGGTCSITPSTERALGTVRWHVISWNKTGFSPWSKANYFKVTDPENPTDMTPEDPLQLRNKSLELPKGPEVVTELADGESSGGSFPVGLLMLGLIGLMRRK